MVNFEGPTEEICRRREGLHLVFRVIVGDTTAGRISENLF
jgi:hypothetical protein